MTQDEERQAILAGLFAVVVAIALIFGVGMAAGAALFS